MILNYFLQDESRQQTWTNLDKIKDHIHRILEPCINFSFRKASEKRVFDIQLPAEWRTTEEKQKINVWIPGSLWKQIGSYGYESPTKATIAAFEALVLKEETGSNQEVLGSSQEEIRKYQEETGSNQEKIRDLEENLRKAPDLVEFSQLRAKYEELEKHTETLKKSLKDQASAKRT